MIAETLASVLEQSHTDWTCVVVNDAQEDGTREVVERLGDRRIHYICDGRRRGQLANFNRAILEVLKYDPAIIRLLSADDVLYPHAFADIVRLFGMFPNLGLVATYFDVIDESGRILARVDMKGRTDRVISGREYLWKGAAVGNTIGGPSSVALRREVIETAGLFDTRLNYAGDRELWHRIAAQWHIGWIGMRSGFQYRRHAESVTVRDRFSASRFTDKIRSIRLIAATEAMFGWRWWIHQYTIGWLHAINVQMLAIMAVRREWSGFRTGLRVSLREGIVVYAPFWLGRLPVQIVRAVIGRDPSARLIWRSVHESFQPPMVAVGSSKDGDEEETLPG